MKSTTYQWKLPLPNSKSHVRNILTVYTYLSFLTVYPMLIDAFLNPITGAPQGFVIIILAPITIFITLLYALITTVVPKKHRKWYWLIIGALALLSFTGILPIMPIIYPLFMCVGFLAIATIFIGFISPILWVILGFRRQQGSSIPEIDTVEEL